MNATVCDFSSVYRKLLSASDFGLRLLQHRGRLTLVEGVSCRLGCRLSECWRCLLGECGRRWSTCSRLENRLGRPCSCRFRSEGVGRSLSSRRVGLAEGRRLERRSRTLRLIAESFEGRSTARRIAFREDVCRLSHLDYLIFACMSWILNNNNS